MKKIIVNILIIGLLAFSFTSCEKEEHPIQTDTEDSPGFTLSSGEITELDDNVSVSVTEVGSGISEFTVTHLSTGNEVATVSISDGSGTATIAKEDIGLSEAGDAATLIFEGNNDLNSANRTSVKMTHPITTFEKSEGDVIENAMPHKLYFEAGAENTTIQNVTIESKVGANADYTEDSVFTNSVDSLVFSGNEYNLGDTVYFKITATDGDEVTSQKEEEWPLSFVVKKWEFMNTGTVKLDTTANQAFNLVDNEYVDSTNADTADIAWTRDATNEIIGIKSDNNAQFVAEGDSLWEGNNVNSIMAAYENAQASDQVQSITEVEPEDYFVYKTTRTVDGETMDYYGMIKITKTYFPADDGGDYLEFEYMNGS